MAVKKEARYNLWGSTYATTGFAHNNPAPTLTEHSKVGDIGDDGVRGLGVGDGDNLLLRDHQGRKCFKCERCSELILVDEIV